MAPLQHYITLHPSQHRLHPVYYSSSEPLVKKADVDPAWGPTTLDQWLKLRFDNRIADQLYYQSATTALCAGKAGHHGEKGPIECEGHATASIVEHMTWIPHPHNIETSTFFWSSIHGIQTSATYDNNSLTGYPDLGVMTSQVLRNRMICPSTQRVELQGFGPRFYPSRMKPRFVRIPGDGTTEPWSIRPSAQSCRIHCIKDEMLFHSSIASAAADFVICPGFHPCPLCKLHGAANQRGLAWLRPRMRTMRPILSIKCAENGVDGDFLTPSRPRGHAFGYTFRGEPPLDSSARTGILPTKAFRVLQVVTKASEIMYERNSPKSSSRTLVLNFRTLLRRVRD
ncbi:hypothetical protein DFH29DRAFT_1069078 [Suillus ampliporus]|nr:hypothetical protein DFH29DRAFT_1069078 [Suillus ampliporus]